MSGERMYPILPCADVADAVAFYEALGFRQTYRQVRPIPHAVVEREDMGIHLAQIDGFDPAGSYASVIIVVPDPDELYQSFATGLREGFGKLPVAGIPRMVRPRKRWGTVYGFSVVDPGGNWLRFSKLGDSEDDVAEAEPGLKRVLDVAARLADARGDDAVALETLERGLARHADAAPLDRARALAYRADLLLRLDRPAEAASSLAEIDSLALSEDDRASVAPDVEHVGAVLADPAP